MKHSKKPIKVLFVSHSARMAGAERSLLLLLKYMNRKLFEPIVVLPTSGPLKEEIERLGISTYEIKSPWWVRGKIGIIRFGYCLAREILALFTFYRLIKLERADVFYTNTIVTFSGAISAFMVRKPHIWHIREIVPGNPHLHFFFSHNILVRFLSRLSHRIIANSNVTAAQFQGCKSMGRIEVVYNAVDFEEFRVSTPFPNIDGVKPQDWLVAVVGSLQRRKAQDEAIRAVKIAEKMIPNIRLLLIGEGNRDRGYRDYLRQQASKMGISGKVIFTGYRDDVPKILPHCRVLLMLSWDEPFGRATIEAMASGIPVVGTDGGATREILQDGVTGYLISPQHPSEVAEKLVELYRHPDVAKELGDNGKRIAKERFAPLAYTQRVEEIILKVVNKC